MKIGDTLHTPKGTAEVIGVDDDGVILNYTTKEGKVITNTRLQTRYVESMLSSGQMYLNVNPF